jgi:hypothetical protein
MGECVVKVRLDNGADTTVRGFLEPDHAEFVPFAGQFSTAELARLLERAKELHELALPNWCRA